MKQIRLTKLKDNVFDGNHPNFIFEGHIEIGYEIAPPTVGERYHVSTGKINRNPFSTSIVQTTLDENNTFTTLYSTYKLEYL